MTDRGHKLLSLYLMGPDSALNNHFRNNRCTNQYQLEEVKKWVERDADEVGYFLDLQNHHQNHLTILDIVGLPSDLALAENADFVRYLTQSLKYRIPS